MRPGCPLQKSARFAPRHSAIGNITGTRPAVKELHLTPAAALDIPLCQLSVLASTAQALGGSVPADRDYYELSSVPPREIVGVEHGPDPQPDGGQDERSSNNDGQPKEQPTGNVAVPHLPKTGTAP